MLKRSDIKKKGSAPTRRSLQRKRSDPEKCKHVYTIDEYDPDLVGTEFLISWGREHIQPVEYNGMDLGPYSVTLTLRPNETVADLHKRASDYLDQIATRDYNRKLKKFLDRIRDANRQVRDYTK